MRRLFSRSGFSDNIAWKWRSNCKLTCLSRSLKECKICNLYGWRLRSVCMMHRTLPSDMRNAWVCLLCRSPRTAADGHRHSGNVLGSVNWGQPARWLVARDRAFFMSLPYPSMDCIWRLGFVLIHFTVNQCWVSVEDPVPISSSMAQIRSLPPQCFMLTNFKGCCFS